MDTNLQGHRWLLFKVSYGRVKRKKKSKSGQFYSYFTVGTAFFIGALVICRKESSQSLGNTNHNGKYGGNEERVTTHYFLLFQYQKEGEKDRNVGKMRQKRRPPYLSMKVHWYVSADWLKFHLTSRVQLFLGLKPQRVDVPSPLFTTPMKLASREIKNYLQMVTGSRLF